MISFSNFATNYDLHKYSVMDCISLFVHTTILALCLSNCLPYALSMSINSATETSFNALTDRNIWILYLISLVISLAISAPILLDYILDATKEERLIQSEGVLIPRVAVLLGVIIPDLFILIVVVLFSHYEVLPAVVNIRDSLFVYGWLLYLNKLDSSLWTLPIIRVIAFANACADILGTFSVYYEPTEFDPSVYVVTLTCIVIAGLLYLFCRWFRYYCYETSKDEAIVKKNNITNSYACAFVLFGLADWLIFFVPPDYVPLSFSTFGIGYLTVYTLVLAFSTLVVSVLMARLAREDGLATKHRLEAKVKNIKLM